MEIVKKIKLSLLPDSKRHAHIVKYQAIKAEASPKTPHTQG